jgi:hypothetical protein
MKKYRLLCAGVLLMGASLSFAQAKPDSVCEINVTTPKAGASKAFEAARTKHNDFHKAEKDKHAIMVWEITTGPASGKYLTAVCGMTWKDFDGNDAMDQRDAADRMKTMAPTVESNEASYYVYRADLSSGTEGGTPAKMMTVVHFFVKAGNVAQFTDSIKRINAANTQTKSAAKPARWYSLANGGMGPHFVQVTDRNSWADMQGPDKSLADTLKEAYGADDKTLQTARDAIDHTVSELLEYRAEISYIPSK